MKYTDGTLSITMVSAFSRPFLKLGIKAVDIMEAYYDALQSPRPPKMSELVTAGGNSYSDLKLSITTFGGAGRVDITPVALGVVMRDVSKTLGGIEQAKEHCAQCESTLQSVLEGVSFSERHFQAQLWLSCEGGAEAVEKFMAEKGDAAFKTAASPYEAWKKKYSIELRAINPDAATRIEFKMEPAVSLRDLFIDFTHTAIGGPSVALTAPEHFDAAEAELLRLTAHLGLVSGKTDGTTA